MAGGLETVVVVVRATQRSIIFWVYFVRLFPPPFTYLLVTHTPIFFFIRRYYLLFLYITKSLTLERTQSNLSGFNNALFLPPYLSMSLPLLITLELSLPHPPCEEICRWKTDSDKAQRLFPPIFCVSYSFPLSDSPLVSSHRIYHRMEDQQQLAS